MASLRQIRSRLRTIQSTKQIMRAMQLVSASKFKRAQGRLLQGRQMLGFLDELLQRVLAAAPDLRSPERARQHESGRVEGSHPLTKARADAPEALLVVTSDAGLAGSYNTNLIQLTEAELRHPFDSAQGGVLSAVEGRQDMAQGLQLSFIGKRGHRYFTRRGYAAKDAYLDFAGRPDIAKIDAIGNILLDRFLAGEVSAVRLLHAKFVSTSVSRPLVKSWLPIKLSDKQQATSDQREEYIFEPSAQRVFEDLLPRWAIATFRLSLLEAFTSEHGARMIAMKNATDNAEELLGDLTRQRNRVRQASITKELSEIVGTAEALK